MEFDPTPHKVNLVIIRCGQHLFPEEKNVTKLLDITSRLLKVKPEKLTTANLNHPPNPSETGPFFQCPECGQNSLSLSGLCRTCSDAEGGKFKSKMECPCGYIKKSKEHIITLFRLFGYDFGNQIKVATGRNFTIPRKDCPQCGRKDGLSLKSICPSCADSEGGKYHTMYSCEEMGPDRKPLGCGFKTEKSEKFMAQRMSELNPNWEGGMKQDMGIKTITDNGVK